MYKIFSLILLAFVFILIHGCDKNDPEPVTEYPQIYINELMPDNEATLEDNQGEHDDWIEIYNPGVAPVNIAGMYFSDDVRNLRQYQVPFSNEAATTIPAKGFLIMWADEQPGQGETHMNFRMSSSGESIFISGNGSDIIDMITYGPGGDFDSPPTDYSGGRKTDGSLPWVIFDNPTPGAPNQYEPPVVTRILINEFMAGNDFFIADEFGEYNDWVEIYNTGPDTVNIGGWYITDDSTLIKKWQIADSVPETTTILPGKFLLLWADEQPDQGVLHVGIKLNVAGETIGISSDGEIYDDMIVFGEGGVVAAPQANDSGGRETDASTNWVIFESDSGSPPTPGTPNNSTPL